MKIEMRILASLAMTVTLLMGTQALAQDDTGDSDPAAAETNPEAHTHLQAALKAYNTADYDTAAKEFKATYDIDAKPAYLYGLAQSYRLGGNCDKAILVYKAYLRTSPTDALAKATQQNIKDCQTALTVHSKPPTGPTPSVPPGGSAVTPPRGREVMGSTTPDHQLTSFWYRDPWGWALVGAGALGVGIGVAYLVEGFNLSAQAGQSSNEQEQHNLLDQSSSDKLLGGVLMGVGAIAAGVGVVKFAVFDEEAGSPYMQMSAAPMPGGGMLTFSGTMW
jgi:hypothetical protein